jgi:hypothetical protein
MTAVRGTYDPEPNVRVPNKMLLAMIRSILVDD